MARRGRSGKVGRWLILVAVLAALAIGGWAYVTRGWKAAGPLSAETGVTVPEGASLAAAARALEKAGAIRSTTGFLRDVKLFGTTDPIRAGEYAIPARASEAEILALLQSGKVRQRLVVVPEGMPSILVQQRLATQPLLTGPAAIPAEGSVLPDGYSFERNEARAAVLARMQAAMTKALAEEWKRRRPTTAVASPREALILASIVEKETALASERRMVAAVYSNRLRAGMMLQADPTTIYPITHGKPLGRRIRKSELAAVNGYNTYAMAGLPAGPICNPGRASIAAVLDPADSRALYFVADGKGGHVFAETLAQHNANVQRYYALRRARGEM
ncbi:endolytic transglycosylase MltG [Sphingomonas profundi]|uniref:endolytic transglycosylase MltG n=1 Tax=Alterirhizorhabdus profundi TaxID=2681549 RepID=UPI0012E96791|nr:endolytic transglycosylase MltG [Sphingomonas profundi]